jgi:hypothetical protein
MTYMDMVYLSKYVAKRERNRAKMIGTEVAVVISKIFGGK